MKIFRDQRGFSLVELIVVMAIVVILTAVAFVAVGDNTQRAQLKRSLLDFSVVMRDMQNSAMTGQMQSGNVPTAYGIYISDQDTYQFFQDLNDNEAWDAGETLMSYDLENLVDFDLASFTPSACHATNGCTIISPVPRGTFCYDNDNSSSGDCDNAANSVEIFFETSALSDSVIFNTFSGKISY